MAIKKVTIGSLVDFHQYDDGSIPNAIDTDGMPIKIGQAAVNEQAVRLDQLPTIGTVTSSDAVITDHAVVRGDGGARKIQSSLVTIDDTGNISLPAGATVDGLDISVNAVSADAVIADNAIVRGDGGVKKTQSSAFYINDAGDLYNAKVMLTIEGGVAIKLTNKTGSASVKGQLVIADTANNDAVVLAAISDVECFGVFYESGIADGSEVWIVVSGIADVLFEDNHGPTRGDWVATSTTDAGYAVSQASPAAAPTHFTEIGHCIETVVAGGAGTHVAARCVLHFN